VGLEGCFDRNAFKIDVIIFPMIEIIIKIIVVFVGSFIFGLERQRAHKQVGFGTFIFVAIGSCALTITSLEISQDSVGILGAIMTGVGFLGAGALIRNNDKIFGFTTAASIWVFAAFGVLVGVGDYIMSAILYLFIWIVIFYDRYLEKRGIGSYRTRIVIETNKICSQEEVMNFLKKTGVKKTKLMCFNINREENKCSFTYFIEGETSQIQLIPKLVNENKWIHSLRFD
jgi:putative Mg2+ transporter-C (MgtC) family protein